MRIGLVILLFACGTAVAQTPFMRVRRLLMEKEYRTADKLLDSCGRKAFCTDSVLAYRTMLLTRTGEQKQAKKTWKKLSSEHPAYSDLEYLRGLISFNETAYGRAIDEFSAAIRKNPAHYRAIYNRSLAYGMVEEFLFAIEDLSRLLEIDSANAGVFYARAYWYEYTGNYTEAAKDYNAAIALDPVNYDAYFGLAFSYKQLGEPEKACEAMQKAVQTGSQIAPEVMENYCR